MGRYRDLVLGPVTSQVDTDTGHDGGGIPANSDMSHQEWAGIVSPQTHCGQVERVGGHEVGGLGELLVS